MNKRFNFIQATHIIFLLIICIVFNANAQESNLYVSNTTIQKRAALYQNLTRNVKRNLSYPLKKEYEDHWLDGFATLELLQYKDSFINRRINNAIDSIEFTTAEFQKQLIGLVSANYRNVFKPSIFKFLYKTKDPEVFCFAAEYILQDEVTPEQVNKIIEILNNSFGTEAKTNFIFNLLRNHLDEVCKKPISVSSQIMNELLDKNFLKGATILFSFQRHNRDYPGMAIIRKQDGNFIKDSTGAFYHIPQLARSITGMPYYLRYGNTPQGIYKLNGFGVSMSSFIGPTPNIQMQMPGEVTLQTFFSDSTITDSAWNISYYEKLLPTSLRNYKPLYESYYAGLAGRSEIIAHGTTINPDYYFGKPYFPHTPSEGCLSTIELWNGKRFVSNQQLIINGLLLAGGAHGYCLVIDIDDKKEPVTITDLQAFLKAAEKE